MPIGISLLLGVNFIDPVKYDFPVPPMPSPTLDAQSIVRIAREQGFWTKLLLNAEATFEHATADVQSAANILQPGDIFFLYFSGHGSKKSTQDSTMEDVWLLYDRMISRSEVRSLMASFRPGVRILIISDSCNSGGMLSPEFVGQLKECFGSFDFFTKSVPRGSPENLHPSNDPDPGEKAGQKIAATLLFLASSGPDQNSIASSKHGIFTQKLLTVWNQGEFVGSYGDFYVSMRKALELFQQPVIEVYGSPNRVFTSQQPFTI